MNTNLLKQEIEQAFQQRCAEVKYDDPFRNAKITVMEIKIRKIVMHLKLFKRKK